MKKIFLFLAVLFGVITASARGNYTHDVEILPEAAREVIEQNFNAAINHIRIGKDFGRIREYDVVMTDGTEIYFDKHGNWKEIEVGRGSSVPATLFPTPISTFVKENQKKVNVTGIEKKAYGYEVELSNGIDIQFTPKGKFIRYDD